MTSWIASSGFEKMSAQVPDRAESSQLKSLLCREVPPELQHQIQFFTPSRLICITVPPAHFPSPDIPSTNSPTARTISSSPHFPPSPPAPVHLPTSTYLSTPPIPIWRIYAVPSAIMPLATSLPLHTSILKQQIWKLKKNANNSPSQPSPTQQFPPSQTP